MDFSSTSFCIFAKSTCQTTMFCVKKYYYLSDITLIILHFTPKAVLLHRVFHSIRFKVNKVGIQRYPFFYALKSEIKIKHQNTDSTKASP